MTGGTVSVLHFYDIWYTEYFVINSTTGKSITWIELSHIVFYFFPCFFVPPSGFLASSSSARCPGSVATINTFILSMEWPHFLVSAAHAAVRRNGHKCCCPSPSTQIRHPVPHLSLPHLARAGSSMWEGKGMGYRCQSLIDISSYSKIHIKSQHWPPITIKTPKYQPRPIFH